MAKKRRAKSRTKKGKRRRITQWLLAILAVLVIFMGVYIGHQVYERHVQQEIIQKKREAKQKFIKDIAPAAKAMQNEYGIKASITMAQAILESDWGTSKLAFKYHNLFGIKGTGENTKTLKTKEYVNGKWKVVNARFKVYDSWTASIKDHTKLMLHGTDGNENNYTDVVNAKTYKKAAIALQNDGYATDPDYASKLISVIETYNLDKYDK